MLNALHRVPSFNSFSMNNPGPQISHLSFADDTIIFSSGRKATLQTILKTLANYERVLGKLINKNKCSFTMAPNITLSIIRRVGNFLNMRYEHFPIKYLGCPIYTGRKTLDIFPEMINKVINKIKGWQLKFLSSGGRATLIRHVLLALNVHTLAAVHPPKGIFELIETYLTRFYWTGNEEGGTYHWISWDNLSYPYKEGGSNFRKLEDTYKAFTAKQWWKFRTIDSLLSKFLRAKYCREGHPSIIQWKPGQSHSWKVMLQIRSEIDHKIWWKVRQGNINFWFDNWTKQGPLCDLMEDINIQQLIPINEVFKLGQWDWTVLVPYPSDQIKEIINNCYISLDHNTEDTPYSTPAETGIFSVSSAWNFLRHKKPIAPIDSRLWHKDVPYKIHDSRNRDSRTSLLQWEFCTADMELLCRKDGNQHQKFKPQGFATQMLELHNKKPFVQKNLCKCEIPNNWNNLLNLMESKLVDTCSVAVKWIKPPLLFVKLNSDGSGVGSSSGGGGVVRDSMGNFIMSFILPLGIGTSNTAEANAFLFGLKWCIDNGYNLIIAETDSLLLRNCISESLVTPWRIKETVEEIRKLVLRHDIIVKHCFREANKVADKLASMSHDTEVTSSPHRSKLYAETN
ncbi:uncharacterized protein LOC132046049 [Lycium ferocissimum]|uniref:uncharacterized protein LOC132046049 n=1 Tax=Lycium ferocissimum TaxID=112874 RepID=UPI0028156592|nr:uncharacterized protein LOC132046049 [Lycium ferocissimum]